MEPFPHLKLITKKTGTPIIPGGGPNRAQTLANKADRPSHSGKLQRWVDSIKATWQESFAGRDQSGLAPLEEDTVTVFLQVNPDILLPTFDLESYGIEVISEEKDGYIIGASTDNFRTLENKIAGFLIEEHATGKIADFWTIIDGDRKDWRPKHILSETLFERRLSISDDDTLRLEVSIAFAKPIKAAPDPTKRGGEKRLQVYNKQVEERDDALMKRQNHFENFINHYGTILSSLIELEDSFSAEVKISGKGFKDLVENYPYVFEIVEMDEVFIDSNETSQKSFEEIELLPPPDDAPIVGVIDSGVMENHKLLSLAIDKDRSISYLKSDNSTADHVANGGHGTKVAGAILYPKGVSSVTDPYNLPCLIRNLRVLNSDNFLQDEYTAPLKLDHFTE